MLRVLDDPTAILEVWKFCRAAFCRNSRWIWSCSGLKEDFNVRDLNPTFPMPMQMPKVDYRALFPPLLLSSQQSCEVGEAERLAQGEIWTWICQSKSIYQSKSLTTTPSCLSVSQMYLQSVLAVRALNSCRFQISVGTRMYTALCHLLPVLSYPWVPTAVLQPFLKTLSSSLLLAFLTRLAPLSPKPNGSVI